MSEQEIENHRFIVVGGGVSGLLMANLLRERGLPFLGLEKAEVLGGRAAAGHHRLYTEEALQLFQRAVPATPWKTIVEAAKLRSKGEWEELDEENQFESDEKFYLRKPFFAPTVGYGEWVERLGEGVKESYQLRNSVTAVDPAARTIECLDGKKFHYENLFWCSSLSHLNRLWKGDRAALQRVMKKGTEARGGIDVEWELTERLVPLDNTLVFPFRFKDHKLRALGIQEEVQSGQVLFHVMVFLDEEINDDREEVAKCLRTMRREMEKEFPELKQRIKNEKIVYLPEVSGERATGSKGLELAPHLFYVGPQISLEENETEVTNLDLIAKNCVAMEHLLFDKTPET